MLELKEILGEDIDSENKKYLQNMRRKLDEDKLTWILGSGNQRPGRAAPVGFAADEYVGTADRGQQNRKSGTGCI